MDDFKALNDRYGHAEGDRALTAVGRVLRRAVRDCDVVARMGGDEFTIMALDADRAAARIIQKRVEERIALLNASGELAAPVSLTIGHTRVRPTDNAGIAELMARADSLLYARKKRRKLTVAAATRAVARVRPRSSLNHRPMSAPVTAVPPDVAAIARAVAVAAASRMPTSASGTPFVPTRMS
jgi:diguanylate cyclase (GGDEF)-like protein